MLFAWVVILSISFLQETETSRASAEPPAAAPVQSPPAPPTIEEPGQWLIHLARHYGHLRGRSDPRANAHHVLSLVQAARVVQPELPQAHLWLFDLYGRLGETDAALAALRRYVELSPQDESAWLVLVDESVENFQTSEERLRFVQSELSRPDLPRTVASDLHRRMAEFYKERDDLTKAGEHVETALRLWSYNIAARRLGFEFFGETDEALQRVELALQLIMSSPGQVNLLWDLGEVLESLGLREQAQEWFLRAIDLHQRSTSAPVSAAYWYRLAESFWASAKGAQALEMLDRALMLNPSYTPAVMLRARIAGRLNLPHSDAAVVELVEQHRAEAQRVLAGKNVVKAAELAWFFVHDHPDQELAMPLAELATSVPNAGPLAERAMGFVLLASGKTDEAFARLQPLADTDPLAAAGLVRVMLQGGDRDQALKILRHALDVVHSGPAYEMIIETLSEIGEPRPVPPKYQSVMDALERFDRRVLDFHRQPQEFIKLSIQWAAPPPPVGPWLVRVRIENIGPVSITLGEGLMIRPIVMLSASLGDSPSRRFDHYTQLLLNRRPVLAPGEHLEMVESVDVGPVREQLVRMASETSPLELRAVLDPIWSDRGYVPSANTVNADPLRMTRTGLPHDRDGINRLGRDLTDPLKPRRLAAIDALGALLAERERQPSETFDESVPSGAIQRRLAELVQDADWFIRARAVEALRWSRQPIEILQQVSPTVHDAHPVVRLMAIRFFAEQQGPRFHRVMESLHQSDPDESVRLLASSYLPPAGGAKQ